MFKGSGTDVSLYVDMVLPGEREMYRNLLEVSMGSRELGGGRVLVVRSLGEEKFRNSLKG